MSNRTATALRSFVVWLAALLTLVACAAMPGREPLRVNVVGIAAANGEGMELRFTVKLRVQNPNDTALDYDGVVLDIDVNGHTLGSGVSDVKGSVPRFGEAVFSVPVTVSAFAAARQVIDGLNEGTPLDKLPYALRGKLAGGVFGSVPFSAEGTLAWPGKAPR
jgi:LEA14-like dessication related protein